MDLTLVAIIAFGIFTGLFQFTKNTAGYTDAGRVVTDEIEYYEQMTEQTHIVEYVDGERVSSDVVVLKNLYRAICLSYELFGNNQQPDFTFDSTHDVMINGTHSPENDNVAYFYTRYLNDGRDVFEVYKRAFGNDANFMFTFNKELSEIPVLNTQVAYYLFHYLFIDSSDQIGQTGKTYYDSYYRGYFNMLEEAETLIISSEPYYSEHYVDYMDARSKQARYTNLTLVCAVVISALILLLVPKYLFGDERTVGYRLFGLGVIRTDGESIPWYITLVKTIIDSVGAIPIAFILYLFPPYNGVYEAMFMPFNPSSKLSFAMVLLAILIIVCINHAFGFFTSKRQNLINMLFSDVTVDSSYPDVGEDEPVNQGREY